MSTAPTVQELLERNKQYAANASPLPFLSELSPAGLVLISLLIQPPATLNNLLTSLQSPAQIRAVIPNTSWGYGQLAVILRNTCGHAAPVINDILGLDHFIGFTAIMVIHHTDCGSLAFTDDQVRATLRKRQPDDKSIDSMNFGTIKNLEQSVRDDLAAIKGSPLVRKQLADRTYGFVYDIKTGLVSPLED